ncbi:MAG: hypothetical protein AVDCRST_MAG77-926 [uncultured Chloroflexi bacterium]|uniref:LysM domain-containing protein n=1 Tax=uncultured Chloroflexota bacterium TaxID=166587 RepID=A0A6J4HQZ4_9CHLR|nr:MAG: hypothetical protein AVDCRST_MAG77-926 [uncultured Chloroflexota bacterium]
MPDSAGARWERTAGHLLPLATPSTHARLRGAITGWRTVRRVTASQPSGAFIPRAGSESPAARRRYGDRSKARIGIASGAVVSVAALFLCWNSAGAMIRQTVSRTSRPTETHVIAARERVSVPAVPEPVPSPDARPTAAAAVPRWGEATDAPASADVVTAAPVSQEAPAAPESAAAPAAPLAVPPPEAASPAPPLAGSPAPAVPAPSAQRGSPIAPPDLPAPRPTVTFHVVVQGDTLYSIARRNGTTVNALLEANQLPSTDVALRIGRRLAVPQSDSRTRR